jgi:hypothetical protein
MILDFVALKFSRLGSSSAKLSSGVILLGRATIAWAVRPPLMMYPPCPSWVGWYEPWAPLSMHFHLGWSGPAKGFGHEGYYARDDHYRYVDHQQDRRASGQENRIVQNVKPDHLVYLKTAAAPSHCHEREAPKDEFAIDESESSQRKTRPGNESSANDEAKPNAERSLEEVAVE